MAKPLADVNMGALRVEMERALDTAASLCDRMRRLSVPSRQLYDRLVFLLPKLPTLEFTASWRTSDAAVRYVGIVESFVELMRLSDSLSSMARGLKLRKLVVELQALNSEVDDVARELFRDCGDIKSNAEFPVVEESRRCWPTSQLAGFVREGTEAHRDFALRQLRYLALDKKMRYEIGAHNIVQSLVRVAGAGSDWQREFACRTLRNLTVDEATCKRICARPHDVAMFVELIDKSPSDALKEHAAGVLLNLTHFDGTSVKTIANADGVAVLIGLVAIGTYRQKEIACGVLFNLALYVGLDGVGPLVNAMAEGSKSRKGHIAGTLSVLAGSSGGRQAIVAAGGIAPVIEMVRDPQCDGAVDSAVKILCLVSGDPDLNVTPIVHGGAINWLVHLMNRESESLKTHALGTLTHLAQAGHTVEVGVGGAAHGMVQLLQNGTKDQMGYACLGLECLMEGVKTWHFVFDAFPVKSLVRSAACDSIRLRALSLKILSVQLREYGTVKSDFQNSLAEAGLVPVLATHLQSGSANERIIAADLLHYVTKFNHGTKVAAIQAGLVSPLVAWIKSKSPTYDMIRTAIAALASLSTVPAARAEMWKAGAAGALIKLLEEKTETSMEREHLCVIFRNLSIDTNFRAALGVPGCIKQLVLLVEHGEVWAYEKEREHSAVALRNFAQGSYETKAAIEQAGGIKALCRFLRDSELECDKSDAIAALWSLADTPDRRAVILEELGLWYTCSLMESERKLDKAIGAGALAALSIGDAVNKEAIGDRGGTLVELIHLLWNGSNCERARAASALQSLAILPRVEQDIRAHARSSALYQLAREHSGASAQRLCQLASGFSRGQRLAEGRTLDVVQDIYRIGDDLKSELVPQYEHNVLIVDILVGQPREPPFQEPGVGVAAEGTSSDCA